MGRGAHRVYTRTGDDGTTGLGGGQRVPKESPRVTAYGTVDELNSHLGVVLASGVDQTLRPRLEHLQSLLFDLGADLCTPEEDKEDMEEDDGVRPPGIGAEQVEALEEWMDELSEELEPLKNFVLPGGHPASAHLHVARCVCRRAEREALALSRVEAIGEAIPPFLNRLSDALFVMARYQNRKAGSPDVPWKGRTG